MDRPLFYTPRKPIYKRWWFWLSFILIYAAILGAPMIMEEFDVSAGIRGFMPGI